MIPLTTKYFSNIEEVGSGGFATVFKAKVNETQSTVALKFLPTSDYTRILREVQCLRLLRKAENCLTLLSVMNNFGNVAIVTNYFEHDPWKTYYTHLSLSEIQSYFRQLLSALCHIHYLGLIHRDVKPGNFLYKRSARKGTLIDFGLADVPHRNTLTNVNDLSLYSRKLIERYSVCSEKKDAKTKINECSCFNTPSICSQCRTLPKHRYRRGGTSGYRAPEVLLGSHYQGTALDLWSVGVMLLECLCSQRPFFKSRDDLTCLSEHIELFGSSAIETLARKLGINVVIRPPKSHTGQMNHSFKQISDIFRSAHNKKKLNCPEVFALLEELLRLDPNERVSSSKALEHNFFKLK